MAEKAVAFPGRLACPEVEIFVRLGVQVPTIGDLPRSIGVVRMGRLAEDAGRDPARE